MLVITMLDIFLPGNNFYQDGHSPGKQGSWENTFFEKSRDIYEKMSKSGKIIFTGCVRKC